MCSGRLVACRGAQAGACDLSLSSAVDRIFRLTHLPIGGLLWLELVIVVEDLLWVDQPTAALLAFVTTRLAGAE